MKTREKSLFVIGLVAALGIGFLIGITVNFPKPDQSELAGTFGKAEKFRKVQMTQKDVELRSELLKDTAQLKSMIQGLVYFSLCSEDVRSNIDLCIFAFKAQGMGSQADDAGKIKAMQDYSDFIANNNKTLNATISLLTAFFVNDSANQSQDVEKNLRDFANYMKGLNEKNQVLSQSLSGFDNYMLTNKLLQSHKTEITQLKSIRDNLLIKGIQLGAILCNNEQVRSLIVLAVGSQEQFNNIAATGEALNARVNANENLQRATLSNITQAIGNLNVAGSLERVIVVGAAVYYSQPDLQYIYLGKPQLNAGVAANAGLQLVASVGAQALNVNLDNYSMQDVIAAMPGRFDAAVFYSMGDLAAGFTGFTNLNEIILLANDHLNVVIGN